jgi:phosphatidylglycerophosphatase A
VGRIPVAPGTFGSVLGVGWFALLLLTGRLWLFVAGTVAGIALSVWLCGVAEEILLKKDPQSVVLDEITAIPVCFMGWIAVLAWKSGRLPPLELFFSAGGWVYVLGVFTLFRFFDVLKPWPVKQSQWLHSGLGVTIDGYGTPPEWRVVKPFDSWWFCESAGGLSSGCGAGSSTSNACGGV